MPAVAFAPAIPLLLWVVPCTALCWWRARTFEAEAGYAAWGAPVWLWAVTGLLLGPFALLAMYLATTPTKARHSTAGQRAEGARLRHVSADGSDDRFTPGDADAWLSRLGTVAFGPASPPEMPASATPLATLDVPGEAGWYPVSDDGADQAYWDGSTWRSRVRWNGYTWLDASHLE
ncbi:MAG: hypothetical protein ABSG81_12105 [Acidimicrobiales bacterium]